MEQPVAMLQKWCIECTMQAPAHHGAQSRKAMSKQRNTNVRASCPKELEGLVESEGTLTAGQRELHRDPSLAFNRFSVRGRGLITPLLDGVNGGRCQHGIPRHDRYGSDGTVP